VTPCPLPPEPGVAGPQEPFEDLSNRPAAARASAHPVGHLPDFWHRVRRRRREPHAAQDREVREVVAHAGDFGMLVSVTPQKCLVGGELVANPLVDLGKAELGTAARDRFRGARGDHSDRESNRHGARQGEPIVDVEALPFASRRAQVDSPVREHAVNVDNQEPDAAERRL